LKVVFGDAKLLRGILVAVSTVVDEVTLKADSEGIGVRALDMAEVSMVDLMMPKSSFDAYEVSEGERIAFRISDVVKLLRSTVPNEKVRIEPHENQLWFYLTGTFTRSFGVPIFGGEAKDLPLPKVNLRSSFSVPITVMDQLVENGRHIADSVRIEAKENGVTLSVKGEISSFTVELLPEDGTLKDYKLVSGSAVSYDLGRLQKIISALGFSESIRISYDTDLPLHINSSMDSKGEISYFIAPKVER